MKRIAIDARIWRAESGGIGRYCRNLVTEILKLDTENEYTVILTTKDEAEFNLSAPNLKKLVLDIPHYSIAEQRDLPSILNKEKFDLVHFTHFNHPLFYRRPFVVTVHDIILHLFPVGNQSKFKRLVYKAVMNDTRRGKVIYAVSEATKKDLVSLLKFPENKLQVTLEGGEERFHVHTKAEQDAIKKKLQLPEQYILFVSRWEKYKGISALVPAFQELSKEFPDLGLVICGKPWKHAPEVADMIRKAQADGYNIITPGFVSDEDLAPLYSAATVYCHPSWYEGFGIMILEAFASGVPTVTSNISSLPEVAGNAALLVNPHSITEITAAIRRILTEPELAATLRARGLERVKRFSWKKMAEETIAGYHKALKD